MLAFELCARLEAAGGSPVALIVSGCVPGGVLVTRQAPDGSDPAAVAALLEADSAAAVLADPVIRQMAERQVRDDLVIRASFQPSPHPVRAPVRALIGRTDLNASTAEMAGWATSTTSSFALTEYDGGHFYFRGKREEFSSDVAAIISASRATAG